MLTYHAAYWAETSVMMARVIDFAGVISYGNTIEEARRRLPEALVDMAETALLRGEALPVPDPSATDEEADLTEPIHIVLSAGPKVIVQVGVA
ncbi:MAG: hypothetical protein JXP34_26365 [Planctomycetes bacterium]|nr:hypothetical protein [Planctomycetota bacterium]